MVQVRDQHGVERGRGCAGVGTLAAQVRDAIAQHRVGEQPRVAGLEQHRRVPEPRHPSRMRFRHPRLLADSPHVTGTLAGARHQLRRGQLLRRDRGGAERLEEAGHAPRARRARRRQDRRGRDRGACARSGEIAQALLGDERDRRRASSRADEWAVADAIEPGGAAAIVVSSSTRGRSRCARRSSAPAATTSSPSGSTRRTSPNWASRLTA